VRVDEEKELPSLWPATRGIGVGAVRRREKVAVRKVPANTVANVGQGERRLMTLDEVAGYLRVHRSTIYRLIKTKQLPGVFKVGADYRVRREALERWVHELGESTG